MNDMENIMTEIIDTPVFVVNKSDYDKVVAELEQIRAIRDGLLTERNTLRNRIDSFKSEIKQFVTDNLNGHVTNDDLKELAYTLDISLTQDISFTATVTFNVTATVPLDFDIDDIDGSDFTASLDYNGSDLEDLDFDYSEVEISDVEVQ